MSRALAVAVFAAALVFVFASQTPDAGFRAGHRGWVSAHTLAIAEKASAQNGFVGYAVSLATASTRDLYYFDRYPVLFSAALRRLERAFADDKAGAILVARQVMNAIYVAAAVVAVLLLVELGVGVERAIAVAALASAGHAMVEYRDMVHYDQPALLGTMLLLWAIARWYARGGNARVAPFAVAAVLLGRGYASLPALGLWCLAHAWHVAVRTGASPGSKARSIATSVPVRALLVASAVAVACLAYNVITEARVRGVPVAEAGILASAAKRLSLDESFNETHRERLGWQRFLDIEAARVTASVRPWNRSASWEGPAGRTMSRVVAALVVLIAGAFAATRPAGSRSVWLIAAAAGPSWLLLVRGLAAFHPYTAIYLFPLGLVFFAAVLELLPQRTVLIAAFAACTLLITCTAARNGDLAATAREGEEETADMQRVAAALDPHAAVAADARLFHGIPFALGFYLPGHDIVVAGPAELVLSRSPRFDGENLTPDNRRIRLFHPYRRYVARSPLLRRLPEYARP